MQAASVGLGKESAVELGGGRQSRILLAILVASILAAFSNSLRGEFVYDDAQQIVTNQLFGHWDRASLLRVLTHDIKATLRQDLPEGHVYSYYYRPGFVFYLMTAYELAGANAFRWHCASLALHILASLLAFLVVRKTFFLASAISTRRQDTLAFLAALIFAIHPIQCESVSWISGSVNSLAAVLVLSSAFAYLTYKEALRRSNDILTGKAGVALGCSMLLFGLALLAKESSLFVLPLIAAHEFFVFPSRTPAASTLEPRSHIILRRLLPIVPLVLVTVGYFIIRLRVLGAFTGEGGLGVSQGGFIQTAKSLANLPGLVARYCWLSVFPSRLSVNYDFNRVTALTVGTFWAPLLLLVASGLLLSFLWIKSRAARIGILWLVLPLLPHLNSAFFSYEELIHDRYLYLSMLGLGILLSLLAHTAWNLLPLRRRVLVSIGATAVVLLFCIATLLQNRVWRDNYALWSNAVRSAPNSRLAHFWMGALAESRQDLGEAASQYSDAAQLDPNCIDCWNNLAFVYAHQGRWEDSIRTFERVVSLTPGHSIAHFNLSFAYAVVLRYKDAIREQRLAIDLDPNGPRVQEWLARQQQLEAKSGS